MVVVALGKDSISSWAPYGLNSILKRVTAGREEGLAQARSFTSFVGVSCVSPRGNRVDIILFNMGMGKDRLSRR